jgi:hypothetical protein
MIIIFKDINSTKETTKILDIINNILKDSKREFATILSEDTTTITDDEAWIRPYKERHLSEYLSLLLCREDILNTLSPLTKWEIKGYISEINWFQKSYVEHIKNIIENNWKSSSHS